MIRGIFIAASGLLVESARRDVIANNLANATTNGFKRSESIASPFGEMLLRGQGIPGTPAVGPLEMGAQVEGVTMIDSQGALRFTGNTLDMALTSGNLQAAEPRIRDADMAQEMIDFTRNQILQQSGTAMLAQANQAPQSILQLLG